MRIPSQNVSENTKAPLTERAKGPNATQASFLGKPKKAEDASKKELAGDIPISKQELMKLAADFKSGAINREQANSRFVATVINNSIQNKLGEIDRLRITEEIEKFVSRDPDFLNRFAKNLGDLA